MYENSKGVFFASWACVTHELGFVGSWREPVASWVVDAELVAVDVLKSKCQKWRKEKEEKKEEEEERGIYRRQTYAFPFS
jgi:hypothetical protein